MRRHACWDCWPPTTARTWRGRWNAPPGIARFPGPRWSGFWRRRRARARCGNRCKPKRRNNSKEFSARLPYRLVPRRSISRCWKKRRRAMKKTTKTTTQLRDECLSHCATLGIPLEVASLDEVLSKAEKESLSHLQFLDLLLGA